VFEHEVTPAVPVIDQVIAPLGAEALLDPVTIAVKSKEPPKVADPVAPKRIVGVATATTVELDEVTAATE
jgi:hypothetical protein